MGQYQQWLLAQEADRRLTVELESLETELLYLKERVSVLEQTVPESANLILQALVGHLQDQSVQEEHLSPLALSHDEIDTSGSNKDISAPPASELTETKVLPVPRAASLPYFPAPISLISLPPDDIQAFFEEHRPAADPRFATLRPSLPPPSGVDYDQQGHMVDAETLRLNESIQRWFERWHGQITDSGPGQGVPRGK